MNTRINEKPDSEDGLQPVVDALGRIDYPSLSFVQLRRLNAALLDASKRTAHETERRADDDVQGDTVRVPIPNSLDR